MTHFARSYAVTNDKLFQKQYITTLKIRNGETARPKDYHGIYWDLKESVRIQRHPLLKKESLSSKMETLPFSDLELAKLKESEYNSNDLAAIEKKAFEIMKNGNNKLAIELLYSQDYYRAKEKIMLPIDEMLSILNERLDSKISILDQKIGNQFTYILIIGILFILGNIVIYILLRKKVTTPIEYLTKTISQIQNNEANIAKKSFYDDEIGQAIEQFFQMKKMIDTQTKNLQEQKKFVQTLIDSQDQIIITTDGTNLVTANETFYDFFAVDSVDEFREAYGAECICDAFDIEAPEEYLQINMGRERWIDYVISRSFGHSHKVVIKRNEHKFIFSVTAAKLPGEGDVKSAVFTDITEMENAKKELESSKKQLEFAFNAGNLGLWDWRPQSGELYMNDIWETMLGYEVNTFENTTDKWVNLVHPDDRDEAFKALQEHIDGKTDIYHFVHRLKAKDGTWKWVDDFGKVESRDKEGNASKFVGVHIDITEIKEAKEKVEQTADKLQEKLDELNRFQRLAVNRELKMIELKEEVNQFLQDKGQDAKYKIVDLPDDAVNNN